MALGSWTCFHELLMDSSWNMHQLMFIWIVVELLWWKCWETVKDIHECSWTVHECSWTDSQQGRKENDDVSKL